MRARHMAGFDDVTVSQREQNEIGTRKLTHPAHIFASMTRFCSGN